MNDVNELAELEVLRDDAAALTRLQENEDFKRIFVEKFLKAFAITNAQNFAYFDRDARARSLEQIAARGVFTRFQDEILNDGAQAEEEIKTIEA